MCLCAVGHERGGFRESNLQYVTYNTVGYVRWCICVTEVWHTWLCVLRGCPVRDSYYYKLCRFLGDFPLCWSWGVDLSDLQLDSPLFWMSCRWNLGDRELLLKYNATYQTYRSISWLQISRSVEHEILIWLSDHSSRMLRHIFRTNKIVSMRVTVA